MEKKEAFCIYECGKYSNPFNQPFTESHECLDKYMIRESGEYGPVSQAYEAPGLSHHHNNEGIMSPSDQFYQDSDKCSLDQLSERNFQDQDPNNIKLSEKELQIQLKESSYNQNALEFRDPLDFYGDSDNEEENLGNNTKPCLTNKDFQSIPDLAGGMEPDLPAIPIIKLDKEISDGVIVIPNARTIQNSRAVEEMKNDHTPKDDAIILRLPELETPLKISQPKEILEGDKILSYANKVEESKSKEKDSFEWNNFLVRRACFRGLSEFYKKKFSKINISWQRKRVNKKKKTPMHDLIKQFATNEFGKMVDGLSEAQWKEFRDTLYSVLFSHRYKKTDEFLEGVNFSTIRGVLYSYTTELRVELMSNPFFSIMMLKFLEKGRSSFLEEKLKGKPVLYSEEVKSELESLEEEAKGHLSNYKFVE